MKTPALIASLALAGILAQPVEAQLPAQVAGTPLPTLAPMIKKVSPTVVGISTRGTPPQQRNPFLDDPFFRRFMPPQQPSAPREMDLAAGSGVIVDARNGYVITNAHVIANATKIIVTLDDGGDVQAEVVGKDEASDIALLKVKGSSLSAIALGDSSTAEVGDFVVAIGNPFGFEHTVTSGIVSALGRSRVGDDPNSYQDFIQTDASINPGNSGGALVNLRGELIGINAAIYSGSGGNIGIGFAIPVNMVKSVMQQLIEHGEVKRGMVGVEMSDKELTPEVARSVGAPASLKGALIVQVTKDSPADKAGVKAGDIITSVNGKQVKSNPDLRNMIGLMRPGEKVTLGLFRDGRQLTVNAVTVERTAAQAAVGGDNRHPLLPGVELANAAGGNGVLIRSVAPNSPLASRLQADDVIFGANRQVIQNVQQFLEVTRDRRTVALNIRRGSADFMLVIQE